MKKILIKIIKIIKKTSKVLLMGCLGILLIKFIFLLIAIYIVSFPDTPEEIERKNVELKEELKEEIEDKTIDDYITNFKIKPNYKNPDFNPLITEFKNQRDRFKFNKCEFSYNDNNFYFEDSLDHITSIFGSPDESDKTIIYRYPKGEIKFMEDSYTKTQQSRGKDDVHIKKRRLNIYDYPDDENYGDEINSGEGEEGDSTTFTELELLRTRELNKLQERYKDSLIELSDEVRLTYETFKITLNFHRDKNTKQYVLKELSIDLDYNKLFDVIMFRGIPYRLNMEMYDFLDLSNLTRKDLDWYRLYIYEYNCSKSSNEIIYTKIESKPFFETSGAGHLTWTGDHNPNKSRSINYITFSLNTLKDLKNIEMRKANLLD